MKLFGDSVEFHVDYRPDPLEIASADPATEFQKGIRGKILQGFSRDVIGETGLGSRRHFQGECIVTPQKFCFPVSGKAMNSGVIRCFSRSSLKMRIEQQRIGSAGCYDNQCCRSKKGKKVTTRHFVLIGSHFFLSRLSPQVVGSVTGDLPTRPSVQSRFTLMSS